MARNNKFEGGFADMVGDGQATHYAGNFFYRHLAELWQQQIESLNNINNTELSYEERLIHLEKLHDLVIMQRESIEPIVEEHDKINLYNEDEESYEEKSILKVLRDSTKDIKAITKGAEFFTLVDEPKKVIELKTQITFLRQFLWRLQFKYGMMMPNKQEKNYGHAWA